MKKVSAIFLHSSLGASSVYFTAAASPYLAMLTRQAMVCSICNGREKKYKKIKLVNKNAMKIKFENKIQTYYICNLTKLTSSSLLCSSSETDSVSTVSANDTSRLDLRRSTRRKVFCGTQHSTSKVC